MLFADTRGLGKPRKFPGFQGYAGMRFGLRVLRMSWFESRYPSK